jgi:hypothetical protein
MPAMQEQLQAMAMERMAPMPCGFYLGMAGMPAMQEQLQAMAMERMAPMPCGFHSGMAGMPAMQEQLQAMAIEGLACLSAMSLLNVLREAQPASCR